MSAPADVSAPADTGAPAAVLASPAAALLVVSNGLAELPQPASARAAAVTAATNGARLNVTFTVLSSFSSSFFGLVEWRSSCLVLRLSSGRRFVSAGVALCRRAVGLLCSTASAGY
jgi:hypothetical protein